MREIQLNMRLNGVEHDRLVELANHYGLSTSGLLRMLVKVDADRVRRDEDTMKLRRTNGRVRG